MKEFKINTSSITERDTESITRYLREVNHFDRITPDEEARLAHIIRQGGKAADEAKETLIKANLRFVISVANQYKGYGMELCDLISEGNIGLVKAATLFDATRGFKFISYAVWWIRQSIMSAISASGSFVRMPQNKLNIVAQYRRMQQEVQQSEQRPLTIEEFADATGLDAVTVHNIVSVSGKVSSIDTPLSDDSDTVFADTLMSASVTDSLLDRESLDIEIEDILNTYLSDREMIVVRKYYGIGCAEATLDDIAATIGKSRERTRQIYLNAIAKLRRSPKTMSLAMYLAA